jgi:hypothetical protein
MIAYISTAIQSVSLLSIGVAVLVILYVPLFLYRWKEYVTFGKHGAKKARLETPKSQ